MSYITLQPNSQKQPATSSQQVWLFLMHLKHLTMAIRREEEEGRCQFLRGSTSTACSALLGSLGL